MLGGTFFSSLSKKQVQQFIGDFMEAIPLESQSLQQQQQQDGLPSHSEVVLEEWLSREMTSFNACNVCSDSAAGRCASLANLPSAPAGPHHPREAEEEAVECSVAALRLEWHRLLFPSHHRDQRRSSEGEADRMELHCSSLLQRTETLLYDLLSILSAGRIRGDGGGLTSRTSPHHPEWIEQQVLTLLGPLLDCLPSAVKTWWRREAGSPQSPSSSSAMEQQVDTVWLLCSYCHLLIPALTLLTQRKQILLPSSSSSSTATKWVDFFVDELWRCGGEGDALDTRKLVSGFVAPLVTFSMQSLQYNFSVSPSSSVSSSLPLSPSFFVEEWEQSWARLRRLFHQLPPSSPLMRSSASTSAAVEEAADIYTHHRNSSMPHAAFSASAAVDLLARLCQREFTSASSSLFIRYYQWGSRASIQPITAGAAAPGATAALRLMLHGVRAVWTMLEKAVTGVPVVSDRQHNNNNNNNSLNKSARRVMMDPFSVAWMVQELLSVSVRRVWFRHLLEMVAWDEWFLLPSPRAAAAPSASKLRDANSREDGLQLQHQHQQQRLLAPTRLVLQLVYEAVMRDTITVIRPLLEEKLGVDEGSVEAENARDVETGAAEAVEAVARQWIRAVGREVVLPVVLSYIHTLKKLQHHYHHNSTSSDSSKRKGWWDAAEAAMELLESLQLMEETLREWQRSLMCASSERTAAVVMPAAGAEGAVEAGSDHDDDEDAIAEDHYLKPFYNAMSAVRSHRQEVVQPLLLHACHCGVEDCFATYYMRSHRHTSSSTHYGEPSYGSGGTHENYDVRHPNHRHHHLSRLCATAIATTSTCAWSALDEFLREGRQHHLQSAPAPLQRAASTASLGATLHLSLPGWWVMVEDTIRRACCRHLTALTLSARSTADDDDEDCNAELAGTTAAASRGIIIEFVEYLTRMRCQAAAAIVQEAAVMEL